MNFNLDDKQTYLSERRILKRMPLANLKKLVGELYVQRFDNNDIELDGYYRLATSVLLDRKENKTSLISVSYTHLRAHETRHDLVSPRD